MWKKIKPEILRRWGNLAEDDLEACACQFDLIVEAIRKTYFPGRSHLTLEGEIRDWLVERLQFYEGRADNA
ncbi:MAG: hypothetical protein HY466_07630 [Deltaproteobacteria bacterium]|nr:hypothetical protein [Deltaproteobacteria bacterium]